jgi:nickel/cobalt exporter
MNKKLILSLLFLFFSQFIIVSQGNPFFSENKIKNQDTALPHPGLIQELLGGINSLQRELNSSLSTLSRKIKEDKDVAVFFILLGIALFYGFIHALGPGHGKTVMFSYALANPLKAKQGILLGIFIAVIHTLSAVFLVSILYFILKSSYSGYAQEPKKIISLISYGLIGCMGLFLLIKTLISVIKLRNKNNNPESQLNNHQNKIKHLIITALIIGLIPCEGAILILIFSISIDAFYLGIILSMAMSLGMAITISTIGILTIFSKNGALCLFSRKKGITRFLSSGIQILGAAVILLFGLLLFLSNLI